MNKKKGAIYFKHVPDICLFQIALVIMYYAGPIEDIFF